MAVSGAQGDGLSCGNQSVRLASSPDLEIPVLFSKALSAPPRAQKKRVFLRIYLFSPHPGLCGRSF